MSRIIIFLAQNTHSVRPKWIPPMICANPYHNGAAPTGDESDCDHRVRYIRGYEIAPDKMHLITHEDYLMRHLLGIKIPADKVHLAHDRAAISRLDGWAAFNCRARFEIEKADILEKIEHGGRFAIRKILFSWFRIHMFHVAFSPVSKDAPTWLELIGPDGEIVFRAEAFGRLCERCADPVDARLADVAINEICPGLYNPIWGIYRAGEVVGTVFLSR